MMTMKVAPGFVGSLFCGSGGCELAFDTQSLASSKSGQPVSRLTLEAITDATAKKGYIWSKIIISTPNHAITLDGVVNARATKFIGALRHAIGHAKLDSITRQVPRLEKLTEGFLNLLSEPRYLSHRDIESWKSNIAVAASIGFSVGSLQDSKARSS